MDNIVHRAVTYVYFISSDPPVDSLLDLLFHSLSCHDNWSPTLVFITDVLSSVFKSFHSLDSDNYVHAEPSFFRRFQVARPLTIKKVNNTSYTSYCACLNCSIVMTPLWHIAKKPFCVLK